MKRKILFMVSSMNIGGVEKSLLSLLDNIPKDKYDITILMLNKWGGFLEYIPAHIKVEEAQWFKDIKLIIMGSPYDSIKRYLRKGKLRKIPAFVYAYYRAKALDDRYYYYKHIIKEIPFNKEEYDVAISYAGPTEIIDTYISHKVKAKKKVAWVHFDISKHRVNEKLYEELYALYDKVFVVSQEAKVRLDEIIPGVSGKSEVMLNVISYETIRKMALEKCNLDNDYEGTKIITVGRLSKEKGQDMAIKTLLKLKSEGYKARWYCIGEGNFRCECEDLIKKYKLEDDFILLGTKLNPYKYMNAADIYVQTSRHEGYCLTLAEVKCLYKPIITTNFTGAREQIDNNITGYIVSEEIELCEKIKYLINYPTNKKRIVENLKRVSLLNSNNTMEKLIKFLNIITK
ncbi:MAG: glycosyltransferase [Clostridium sp.]|uniref:glycosyltransferase n=1 Tax=Clostridium sp. TaxID=1506 RepID=UPI00306F8964